MLIVNLVTIFRVSLFEQFLPVAEQFQTPGGASAADHVVARVISIGLEGKAVALFSLLFGIGLAAQRERTRTKTVAFGAYIARRLAFLLALIWNGDILALYALVGVLAALLSGLSTRVLLVIAAGLFAAQALPLPFPTPFASYEAMRLHVGLARQAYGWGTFREVLVFRVHEVRPIAALLLWISPRTLALFVVGVCAWRAGLLRGERRGLVGVLALVGITTGAGVAWAGLSGVHFGKWNDAIYSWAGMLLAIGYGASFLRLFERPRMARVLSALAPLGRMALTSYLTQSVVLGLLFYGYGLGLFGHIGEAVATILGIGIFTIQVVVSALWLRRYRFGPVEWLWRSFTYGAWQPMRH